MSTEIIAWLRSEEGIEWSLSQAPVPSAFWVGQTPVMRRDGPVNPAEDPCGRPPLRCTAPRYGDHCYSLPPHNTPDDPRDSEGEDDPCQAGLDGCEDDRVYEVVVYQAGTHEWIRLHACVPCTAGLRAFHGPGVASVRTAAAEKVG